MYEDEKRTTMADLVKKNECFNDFSKIIEMIEKRRKNAYRKERLAIRGSHVNSSKEKIESWCKQ